MSQWSLKERLQPSLLDRLTDANPEKSRESADQALLSQQDLKRAVIRDLGWLLNAINLEVVEDLDSFPEVARSVVNFGVPELCGHSASTVDLPRLEKAVREAILQFEPRIIRNSLSVRVTTDQQAMAHNALSFEIQGAIFGQPAPFQVMLRSQLDLENGEFGVHEV